MQAEEFIAQQIKAGYPIHIHDGVWWQRVAPFFYKPVLPLQEIPPDKAKPKLSKLFLGYSYVTGEGDAANKRWSVLLLDGKTLDTFSIKSISSSKRARVRKGLSHNEIRRIESFEQAADAMQEICISAAQRTGHGKPPEYYTKHYREWRDFMTREFSLPGREWWGTFNQGVLVAYYYAYQIEETMFICAAKSHTDFLADCPNDALLYSFLEYCRGLGDCRSVIFGDWSEVPSLNSFKERYGFKRVDLPVYARYNPAVKLLRKIIKK